MFWLDNNSGVTTPPAIPAVVSSTRKYFTEGGNGNQPSIPGGEWFNMMTDELLQVLTLAGIAPDKADHTQLAKAIMAISTANYFTTGQSLPMENIGPIWHDDYHDWMTWQTFNKNGANYTGYASRLIGSLMLDTQPTPRAGYIKSGVQNLSRVTYAALRAWAQHNGLMVAPGVWAAGTIQCADNANGTTFRIYDVRGEFLRAWDDGRGVDAGRVLLSSQAAEIPAHRHTWGIWTSRTVESPLADFDGTAIIKQLSGSTVDYENYHNASSLGSGNILSATTKETGGTEARPRNVALAAIIKF